MKKGDFMDLINQKVKHSVFGIGTITEQSATSVTVQFPSKISKFIYPDAFTKFINTEDISVQSSILKEITDIKTAEEESKRAEEAARKADEARQAAKVATLRTVNIRPHKPDQIKRSHRESLKPMVFFEFQGNTFDKESRGGYIWAPITNKSGSNVHHWNRLLDVRAGDIILHGCGGYVAAISAARGACYNCPRPDELQSEDLWDLEGRRVDCDYIAIQNPIKTSNFKNEILELSTSKYAPFDKDANGNMGYLYEINRDLAQLFVRETVNHNGHLVEITFIKNFID